MKKNRSYWKLIWPQLYSSVTLSKVFRHRGKGCIFSPQRYQSDGRSCCLINGCEATTPPFTVPAQNHGAEIFFSTSPFPFPRWKAAIAGAWNWSRHWNTDKQPECGREQGWDQGDVRKAHCAVFVIWRENSYLLCCCGLLPSSVIIFFFFFQALERRRVAWQGGCSAIWIVYFQKKLWGITPPLLPKSWQSLPDLKIWHCRMIRFMFLWPHKGSETCWIIFSFHDSITSFI